jgi:ABC-type nickel/cobalt efflux system permease component RcnA
MCSRLLGEYNKEKKLDHNLFAIITMAFGFGLLHALDADHVMAVSGLASTRPGFRNSLAFCARWAAGHGFALLVFGSAVFFLGMAIPVEISHWAESLVGLVLIGIGLWILVELGRKHAHLHFHQHDAMPRHAHWHTHDRNALKSHTEAGHRHDHRAVMVGLLHGTAGSAPLLALIPLSKMGSPWYGFMYLVLFGFGVFVSMLIFGGVLGGLFTWLNRWGTRFVQILRGMVAASSVGFGSYLLYGSMVS